MNHNNHHQHDLKITILVDNNTFIDQYYHGEPAASFYIEEGDKKILFDAGYSEILISNAEKMNIDLKNITHIVLSHGHDDHTRGLKFLKNYMDMSTIKLIAHPDCFSPKYNGDLYIGSPFSKEEIETLSVYIPGRGISEISENLIYLGEIPRTNDFENQIPIGKYLTEEGLKDDYLMDDSAVVYKSKKGLFIITGCSHSGICNIIEYAKKICETEKVYGILGGFHLFENNDQLKRTIEYLQENKIEILYPCHCVSLIARAKMMEKLPVIETGVGLSIKIN